MVLDLLLIGLAITLIPLSIMALVLVLSAPHYRFRGSAMGPPAFGSGMTSPLVAVDDPGGGVTGPGGIDGPLMRGLSTGFTQAGKALRNVDVTSPTGISVRVDRHRKPLHSVPARARLSASWGLTAPITY
ncbi:hypothetical protein [Streptomyces virginiae]|uniref:hypothetical protein n=1 Tax=Streptomyces virginiae TaxID=1961 RepID=UPI00224D2236|nr:hypothetical protein [Streptomyces virginiae]MCX5276833.1 hypothetical protein [Streptomyces virginiae]